MIDLPEANVPTLPEATQALPEDTARTSKQGRPPSPPLLSPKPTKATERRSELRFSKLLDKAAKVNKPIRFDK